MSLLKALQSVSYDTWTKDHENMIHRIQKLFPASLRNRLSSHYKYKTVVFLIYFKAYIILLSVNYLGKDKLFGFFRNRKRKFS